MKAATLKRIQKSREKYFESCDRAEEKYLDSIQKLVEAECLKWGFEFMSGMGMYSFFLPTHHHQFMGGTEYQKHADIEFAEQLFPDLISLLEQPLYSGRNCVGSGLSPFVPEIVQPDFLVVITTDEEEVSMDEYPTGKICDFLTSKAECSRGPIQRNLAEAILQLDAPWDHWWCIPFAKRGKDAGATRVMSSIGEVFGA